MTGEGININKFSTDTRVTELLQQYNKDGNEVIDKGELAEMLKAGGVKAPIYRK